MRRRPGTACLVLCLGSLACGDPDPGTPLDGGADLLLPDQGHDGQGLCFGFICGPDATCDEGERRCRRRGSDLCQPSYCQVDEDCGLAEDRCLALPGGEPFCSRRCDAARPCPDGFGCQEVTTPAGTDHQCFPDAGTCDTLGRTCGLPGAITCIGEFPRCLTDDFGARYCSRSCEQSGDCPTGYKYCWPDASGQRVCQRKIDSSAAVCGQRATPLGIGGPCQQGSCAHRPEAPVCLPGANELGVSFCTRVCTTHVDCGTDAFCGHVAGSGEARCIPLVCACLVPPADQADDPLPAGLKGISRGLCDLGHRTGELPALYGDTLVNDPLRLTRFNQLFYAPLAVPRFVEGLRATIQSAVASATPVTRLLQLAAALWDESDAIPAPSAATGTFEEAVLAFHTPTTPAERSAIIEAIGKDAADLPLELREKLAPILRALRQGIDLRQEALRYLLPSREQQERLFANPLAMFYIKKPGTLVGQALDLSVEPDRSFILRHLGYGKLAGAALLIAQAVEGSGLRGGTFGGIFSFNQQTPYGRIVIGDDGDRVYAADDPDHGGDLLFLLEAGGDDTYEIPVGATASLDNPVSLAIDLGGKDTYAYAPQPGPRDTADRPVADEDGRLTSATSPVSLSERLRQGAGNLGVGLLFDLGTAADTYRSLRFSQGSGLLGVGVLFDEGGDDSYLAEAGSQGAALFGLGLLLDGGGNDTYRGYSGMQGSAYVKGVGLLVDVTGDDTYLAQTGDKYVEAAKRLPGDDPIYSHGANQGAAWGRRADYPIDGLKNKAHSSGGAGLLVDLAGKDRYTCGSFCQGTGYWFGLGLLLDEEGNDAYDGRIYTQGASVHFGLGIFHEGAGDDGYGLQLPSIGLSLGFAYDLSLGWHQDLGGDDTYHGAWQSLGTGSGQALGVFLNRGGNDVYASTNYLGLGMATNLLKNVEPTSARHGLRTTGIFVDQGGTDSYSRPAFFVPEPVQEHTTWVHPHMETTYTAAGEPTGQEITIAVPHAFSIGIDAP